jgi:ribitol-5-phosphate 2-dehydrogenase (NADP+) / D-ribitol-5-phosphate cytidylyltransferase
VPRTTGPASGRTRTAAVVLAGGTGARMSGAGTAAPMPKQLLTIAGTTILEHSVRAFESAPGIDAVFVLMAGDFIAQAQEIVDRAGFRRVRPVQAGGRTRSESTRIALDLVGDRFDVVLFHDAARPLIEAVTIAACLSALEDAEAVSVAVGVSDTVVVTDAGRISAIPARDRMRRLQTPQGFRVPTIRAAHALAAADPDFTATDDCGVVLRYLPDVPIRIVVGSERNLKITHPTDLAIAEALYEAGPPAE